jgi:hypothetical protein
MNPSTATVTTLKSVAYFNHPQLGTIRFTWDEDNSEAGVWIYSYFCPVHVPARFLGIHHGIDSIGEQYSILHHHTDQHYPMERARLIWNALANGGAKHGLGKTGWKSHIFIDIK